MPTSQTPTTYQGLLNCMLSVCMGVSEWLMVGADTLIVQASLRRVRNMIPQRPLTGRFQMEGFEHTCHQNHSNDITKVIPLQAGRKVVVRKGLPMATMSRTTPQTRGIALFVCLCASVLTLEGHLLTKEFQAQTMSGRYHFMYAFLYMYIFFYNCL